MPYKEEIQRIEKVETLSKSRYQRLDKIVANLTAPAEPAPPCRRGTLADVLGIQAIADVSLQHVTLCGEHVINTESVNWASGIQSKDNLRLISIWLESSRALQLHYERGRDRYHRDDVATTFNTLATRWRKETGKLSSPIQKAMHPDYQRIIGMGREALPYIFFDLRSNGGHWYWALSAITGHNPVPADDAGNMRKMKEHWLQYAERHGLV